METLEGTINRVIVRKRDGYSVLEVKLEDGVPAATVVGVMPGVQEGERVQLRGRWNRHARFGLQFRAQEFTALLPTSEEGLLRYLASGTINGIGPALAGRLVTHFGSELFEIVEADPGRLVEVEGIGPKRAEVLAAALDEQRAVRQVMVFLQGLGLGPGIATRIYRAWEHEAINNCRGDPYRLVREVEGIGFSTADAIAKRLGVQHDSPSRLAAGLLHLSRAASEAGDTVAVRAQSIADAMVFLEAEEDALDTALEQLLQDGLLKQRAVDVEESEAAVVGQSGLVWAEEAIAQRLIELMQQAPYRVSADVVMAAANVTLVEDQCRAVQAAAGGPVMVITGGPGTGKTTVLQSLVRVLQERGQDIFLCAPTGRAAKRLAETTGVEALTIHRLLGFGRGGFEHNKKHPLTRGVVIVDEVSMVDAPLFAHLLAAIADGSSLVLVGDQDQLPSVGPGNVLGDLIRSDVLPVVRLTEIFRQAADSRIVANAHRIRTGQLPQPSPSGARGEGEFHFIKVEDPEQAQRLVLQVCCERVPQAFGHDPVADVQVLAPMHRGAVGTVALNQLLQQRLNPNGLALKRTRDELRVGDKIMQVRNDYDREVFNGDIGRVLAVDREAGTLTAEVNGADVLYAADQLEQLQLAYCVSIHKSQGSEYPVVIVPLLTQHYLLLQRNLLYTAITRARQLVVLVGSDRALRLAVNRADQATRRTLLSGELRRRSGEHTVLFDP